jgi:hypothetical protein
VAVALVGPWHALVRMIAATGERLADEPPRGRSAASTIASSPSKRRALSSRKQASNRWDSTCRCDRIRALRDAEHPRASMSRWLRRGVIARALWVGRVPALKAHCDAVEWERREERCADTKAVTTMSAVQAHLKLSSHTG